MNIKLSEQQIASFDRDGVLLVDQLIDPFLADEIAERYHHLLEVSSKREYNRTKSIGRKAKVQRSLLVKFAMVGKRIVRLLAWCSEKILVNSVQNLLVGRALV